MRKQRRLTLASAAAAAALLLANCSAGGVSNSSAEDAGELGADASQFLTQRAEELEVQSISVLAQSVPQGDAIQGISAQFTDLTGIDVEWTALDEQSTENRASVSLGAGEGGFDVVQTPSNFIPSYVERGWITSVDELASNEENRVPGWSLDVFGEGTTGLLSRDGDTYGVPMFTGTQLFYYRTDIFEEHGITEPPTTYKELAEVVREIDGKDVRGIALRTAPSVSQLMFDWTAWLYAHGGSYYEEHDDGDYSGAALDSPEALEALKTYTDLVRNHAPSGATNWAVDDVSRAFLTGRVAITQEGAVFGGTFNDPEQSQVAGKVDTFTLPAGPAGSFVPFNAHGWTVASNSDAAEAAWLFVQWATLEQTLTAATQTDANFAAPPLVDIYSTPVYEERYGFGNFVDDTVETIETGDSGGASPFEGDPNYLPATTDWSTVGQRVSEELSKAITGQVKPEEALRTAASFIE